MQKGDVILVPFPFSDFSGSKLRPAIVLHSSKLDTTLCFVTTQFQHKEEYDIQISPSPENGVKKVSLIKVNKITTIDKDLIIGKLGKLELHHIKSLNQNLIKIFQLL